MTIQTISFVYFSLFEIYQRLTHLKQPIHNFFLSNSPRSININTIYWQNTDHIGRMICNNSNIINIDMVGRFLENNGNIFQTCGYQKISWCLSKRYNRSIVTLVEDYSLLQVNRKSKRCHLPSRLDLEFLSSETHRDY